MICSAVLTNALKRCLCRYIGKIYMLLLTFMINLSEVCIILHEIVWIKFMPD